MGKPRMDRTTGEWIRNGDLLVNIIIKTKNKKHARDIKTLLQDLKNPNCDKISTTQKLNKFKYNLGADWTFWLKKISKKKSDKKRYKFYIEETTYNKLCSFTNINQDSEESKQLSDNRMFLTLLLALEELGISNIKEMYDLAENVSKFKDSLHEVSLTKTLCKQNENNFGETSTTILKVFEELNKKKIKNFKSLKKQQYL